MNLHHNYKCISNLKIVLNDFCTYKSEMMGEVKLYLKNGLIQ